jgi:hypothetical protein
MMGKMAFLPGTGRGTMRSMAEGQHQAAALLGCPSVSLTAATSPFRGGVR